MNTIQKERKAAERHLPIKTKSGLIALTCQNVALIEAILRIDSNYSKAGDINAKPANKYSGSTAFWMTQLKNHLLGLESSFSYEKVVYNSVTSVDRDNSTHINADGVGRAVLSERLLRLEKNELLTLLKTPNYENGLIQILSAKTAPKKEGIRPRSNYSFATKYCHYACFYTFLGLREQDNFAIYDNVISKVLPLYAAEFKIQCRPSRFKEYRYYLSIIDAIIETGERISRNGLDHLLWYCYKGQM